MSSSNTVYLFMGAPGSGKGSLAQLCVRNLGWWQLSTGNLCRMHIENQTEIGKAIDFGIKSGKLVPDELVAQMVREWFGQQYSFPGILDGYPRTVVQAQDLSTFLSTRVNPIKQVIVRFVVSDDVIVQRLSNRYMCGNKQCQMVYSGLAGSELASKIEGKCDRCASALIRRKDDEPEVILDRLAVYHRHEQGLLAYYGQTDYVHIELQADGARSLHDVFEDFKKLVHAGV